MPYCENCGAKVGDNANFCKSCGAPQKAMQNQISTSPSSVVVQPVVTPSQQTTNLPPPPPPPPPQVQTSIPPQTQPTYSQPLRPSYVPPPLTPPPQHTPPLVTNIQQPTTTTISTAPRMEEFNISSANLIEKVTELLRQGNLTKIIIKDERGKVLMEIPATVGVAGAVIAPWLAGLGGIAALVTRCTISVVRPQY